MKNNHSPFEAPLTQINIATIASLFQINSNMYRTRFNNAKFVAKTAFGGLAAYALYQSLLIGLKTESLRRKGLISRKIQTQILIESTIVALRDGASLSLSLGITLLIFPWLNLPMSIFGLIGIGKASVDLFNAFWAGLDQLQQTEILIASREAGINLRQFIDRDDNNFGFI